MLPFYSSIEKRTAILLGEEIIVKEESLRNKENVRILQKKILYPTISSQNSRFSAQR